MADSHSKFSRHSGFWPSWKKKARVVPKVGFNAAKEFPFFWKNVEENGQIFPPHSGQFHFSMPPH